MAAPYFLRFRAIALTLRAGLHSLRSSLDGCALSGLHSLRSSLDGCALSGLHSLRSWRRRLSPLKPRFPTARGELRIGAELQVLQRLHEAPGDEEIQHGDHDER